MEGDLEARGLGIHRRRLMHALSTEGRGLQVEPLRLGHPLQMTCA